MIDFGHIGQDKEDCRVECKYILGCTEHHWIKVRDNCRIYGQALFLKPKTSQQEFYSKGLKGTTIAIESANKLWYLAADIRFQDGVIPGFIVSSARYALEALNKARYAVWETIEVLNYNKNKLQYKVEQKK